MEVLKLPSGKFYGRSLGRVDVPGFRLIESSCAAGTILPRHSHACSHFNFVVSGTYQEKISGKELSRRRSALIFIPGDLTHEEIHNAPSRHFIIEVDDRYLARFGKASEHLTTPLDLSGGEGRRLVMRIYQEFSNADALSPVVIEALGLELLTLTARRWNVVERRPPVWLLRVREQLEASFAEPFTLAGLAMSAGVHPVHLAQSFKRWFNCTVGEFVRDLRLNDACRALEQSDASLADIAAAAGFTDQSHLCRVFRRLKATSPSTYRQRARAHAHTRGASSHANADPPS
jgi:AraC family transcriptional regulator